MPEARVTDVAVIAEFRVALANFVVLVRQALIDLEMESQRGLNWITQDRPVYWRTEARRSSELLARAKDDLSNARTFKRMDNYVPSCAEEKKQVDLCRRRLEHAEQKLEAVRRWGLAAPRAVDEFRGPIQQLMASLDGDIPRAMAVLERMSAALQRYAATEAPAAVNWEELSGEAASMTQPVDEQSDVATPNAAEASEKDMAPK
jgi:hypothetical protein